MAGLNGSLQTTREPMWERACSRLRPASHHPSRLNRRYREQARSHRGSLLIVGIGAGRFNPCG
ncbi:hypothetical protein C9I50_18895 [Pseudomonas prosekii]|nr:hypothetical protein C9I50_18895 [Pseudomonas prosekii]